MTQSFGISSLQKGELPKILEQAGLNSEDLSQIDKSVWDFFNTEDMIGDLFETTPAGILMDSFGFDVVTFESKNNDKNIDGVNNSNKTETEELESVDDNTIQNDDKNLNQNIENTQNSMTSAEIEEAKKALSSQD